MGEIRLRLATMLAWLLLFGLAAAIPVCAAQASPSPRSEPVLSREAKDALDRGGRVALWVYFSDKGETNAAGLARVMSQAGARVSAASRMRRARQFGGRFVPDYSDVPTLPRYVQAVEAAGANVRHASRWLNAVSVEADAAAASRMAVLPFVTRIAPVAATQAELAKPTDYGISFTQDDGINAIAAHDSGFSAAGVVVAVLDTGFRKDHTALSQLKRIAEWDFVDSDSETANEAGEDDFQWFHGTGVWSILGGYLPGGLIGPAYNASFILAKVHDIGLSTNADEDHWVAAAQWADSIGVDIVHSSIVASYPLSSLDGKTTPMAKAANTLSRHGVLVVCAMGNSGPDPGTLWTPADCDSVLAVGSVNESNVISSFSSRGPTQDGRGKPDLVAQGENTIWAVALYSDVLGSYPGTSLAAPLVSGAAGLVQEAHPEWSAQQVRYALKSTADKASTRDSTTFGWGRPNVVNAIYKSTLGGPVFPKPFALLSPATGGSVTSSPVAFSWRRSIDLNPGDAVTYTITLKKVSPSVVVYSTSTTDTTATYSGALTMGALYEWNVVATDLASHGRPAAEPFRFTSTVGTDLDIAAPADTTGVEGTPLVLTARSTVSNGSQILTITAAGVPASFSFSTTPSTSPATATLSGTPTAQDAATGPHTITWYVTNGIGGIDSTKTILRVNGVSAVENPEALSGPPRIASFVNRPNPFQATTQIEIRMAGRPAVGSMALRIYDVRGRLVRSLLNGAAAGSRTVAWDGTTDLGQRAASGVYYYRLEVANLSEIRRLILLK